MGNSFRTFFKYFFAVGLSKTIDENVVFIVLVNGNRVPVLRVDHDNPVKADADTIENEHIYKKSTGRVLTVYLNLHLFALV